MGTSSWTFPGWAGLVYAGHPTERELRERGLAEYAEHPLFRTVGVDAGYYRPLSTSLLERWAAALPHGYPCVLKVWSGITTPADPRSLEPNPSFLDPEAFERTTLAPLARAFAGHVGALVLELPPSAGRFIDEQELAARLDTLFTAAGRAFPLSVELRSRSLLGPRYLDVLARHGAAHVLNFWEDMPTPGEQLALPGILPAGFVVARLLIPPGRRYEARKRQLEPFDRIVAPEEGMRADVVRLAALTGALGRTLFVVVNNKAEGSSPLTVRALAERLAE